MIQCRKCSEWGYFARECQNRNNNGSLLCKWCRPRNHEDTDCPKQKGVNMLDMKEPEEVLAITRLQSKKAVYLDPRTKERLRKAKVDIEQAMAEEQRASHNIASTPLRSWSEKTIIKQMLQTTVPIRVSDLLQTMPQLRMALTNAVSDNTVQWQQNHPIRTP